MTTDVFLEKIKQEVIRNIEEKGQIEIYFYWNFEMKLRWKFTWVRVYGNTLAIHRKSPIGCFRIAKLKLTKEEKRFILENYHEVMETSHFICI